MGYESEKTGKRNEILRLTSHLDNVTVCENQQKGRESNTKITFLVT